MHRSDFVLARCDSFADFMHRDEKERAWFEFARTANRCAQALIFASRHGLEVPAEDDPCWEKWANETEGSPAGAEPAPVTDLTAAREVVAAKQLAYTNAMRELRAAQHAMRKLLEALSCSACRYFTQTEDDADCGEGKCGVLDTEGCEPVPVTPAQGACADFEAKPE